MRTGKDVKVGEKVMVNPGASSYGGRRREPIEAVVTRAARVWLTIESSRYVWRMRRDTQRESSSSINAMHQARFLTLEQYAVVRARAAAFAALAEHGIRLKLDSPWRGHEEELVSILQSAASPKSIKKESDS